MSLSLGPATRSIVMTRGSTPRLRLRLTSRNVRSGALTVRPTANDTVEWTLFWPDGPETKSTAANGGLTLDSVSRVVGHPLTEADVARIPSIGVSYTIALVNADGLRFRWLEGTITATGIARPTL